MSDMAKPRTIKAARTSHKLANPAACWKLPNGENSKTRHDDTTMKGSVTVRTPDSFPDEPCPTSHHNLPVLTTLLPYRSNYCIRTGDPKLF